MAGKRHIILKAALGLALAAVVAIVAAYAWLQYAPRRVPQGQAPLVTLDPGSPSVVRDAFNAGSGEIRVLAMLSPT